MKTKRFLLITLAAIIGGTGLWFAPHRSWAADPTSAGHKILYYTCPMHPSVKSGKSGDCPICGMSLVPVYDTRSATGTNATLITAGTNTVPVKMPGCCSSGGCH